MNKEDYNKYYIQGSDHYLIPKDIFDELFNEMSNWKEEAKELKKQLEENKNKINWYENFEINKTTDKLRLKHNTQQKEFINYLENKKDRLVRECSNIYKDSLGHMRLVSEDIFDEVNDILQKYEEIIGDDK